MMLDLRNVSMKQKAQIKELQRDIEHYNCEVENLQVLCALFSGVNAHSFIEQC